MLKDGTRIKIAVARRQSLLVSARFGQHAKFETYKEDRAQTQYGSGLQWKIACAFQMKLQIFPRKIIHKF